MSSTGCHFLYTRTLSLMFVFCLTSGALFAEHAKNASNNKTEQTSVEAVFDPSLIRSFEISRNLVGKSAFPEELPDFQEYSYGSKDESIVDIAQLKNDDPKWTARIRDFWRPRVKRLQRVINDVRELIPEFDQIVPLSFQIYGISDIGSEEGYTNVLVPSDFDEIDVLRKKIMSKALFQVQNTRQGVRSQEILKKNFEYRIPEMKSSDYRFWQEDAFDIDTLMATAYALGTSPNWEKSRYVVPLGLNWTPDHVGRFNTAIREATKLRPRSEATFLNMRQSARNDALKDYFYGHDVNDFSLSGLQDVVQSALSDFAAKTGDKTIMEKWYRFLFSSKDDPRYMKVYRSGSTPRPSLSLAKLLAGFSNSLPGESKEKFSQLMQEYGLHFELLDNLHKKYAVGRNSSPGEEGEWDDVVENDGFPQLRSHAGPPEPWKQKPRPTEMPDLDGWKATPEEIGQLPNKNHTYRVNRKLPEYATDLPGFVEALAKLGKDGHWIDAGSGEAMALEDYLTRTGFDPENDRINYWSGEQEEAKEIRRTAVKEIAKKPLADRAHVTGITLKSRRKVPDFSGKLRNLEGRFLETIPDQELGKADIITDEIGVLSYANQPDVVMNKYLRVLSDDGGVFVNLSTGYTTIKAKNGAELDFPQWLALQPGLVVHIAPTSGSRFSVHKKKGQASQVPKLKFVFSDAHNPPRRVYIEE